MKRREQADEARLLPRFRDRAAMLDQQRKVMRQAVREAVADGREITFPETAYGDPRDVRGLPAITKGVGGTSPQTQPEAEAIRRITRAGG